MGSPPTSPHFPSNTYHCIATIAREEGFRALWKGTLGNYYRMLVWQAWPHP